MRPRLSLLHQRKKPRIDLRYQIRESIQLSSKRPTTIILLRLAQLHLPGSHHAINMSFFTPRNFAIGAGSVAAIAYIVPKLTGGKP